MEEGKRHRAAATAKDSKGATATSTSIQVKISKALKGVRGGKNAATTLSTSSSSLTAASLDSTTSNQLQSLESQIDQAYDDFNVERNMFKAASDIDRYLFAASALAKASVCLENQQVKNRAVNDRIKKIVPYLSFCDDLMTSDAISSATLSDAVKVNASAGLSIGQPQTTQFGSSETNVLPNVMARITAVSANPFSTQTASVNGTAYELGNVSVTFGGVEAAIISASPPDIIFVVPDAIPSRVSDGAV